MKMTRTLAMLGLALGLTSSAFGLGVCATGSDADFDDFDVINLTNQSGGCDIGPYVFSNFQVTAVTGFTNFSFSITISETATGLNIGYTGLTPGQDFQLTYTVTPGIIGMQLASNSATVTELICSVVYDPTNNSCAGAGGTVLNSPNPAHITPGGSLLIAVGGSASNFVFKDIAGGSDVIQNIVPEPMTFSMLGIGLLGIGFAARRRMAKK